MFQVSSRHCGLAERVVHCDIATSPVIAQTPPGNESRRADMQAFAVDRTASAPGNACRAAMIRTVAARLNSTMAS